MEKNSKLKISVVIPMYNASKTIVRALNSIKEQTFKCNYQIIVVNDGSKDNSQEIVEKYIADNPELNIILINQINGGVSKARNTGLKQASGNYIALLDSDDYWLKNKMDRQMKYFTQGYDFVCALRNNDVITFPYKIENNIAKISLRKLLFKVVGQTSTALFKKEILDDIGLFDENQKYSEDANLWMRISLKYKMIIINEKLVITDNDYGTSGLSSNMIEMEKGVKKNIKEMRQKKGINLLEYYFFSLFSELKYIRRKLVR